ncbi:uncharacterized protein LOC117174416 isoform X2 [Belonocnema kinseyi]|uniref:uncharacterized protein LOC117174416 isoform X2 n=1 Tax=Belonocnema kinseyi TaxID=2817044 RepID=UPI00143DE5FF|nr:uncharacterized protein LOC117174416 isoform X2 [Belonocnema kinseyi]
MKSMPPRQKAKTSKIVDSGESSQPPKPITLVDGSTIHYEFRKIGIVDEGGRTFDLLPPNRSIKGMAMIPDRGATARLPGETKDYAMYHNDHGWIEHNG